MLILDEHNNTILLDSLYTPIVSSHFWVLDLKEQDFGLAPIQMIESMVSAVLTLKIGQFAFDVPANWHLMVYDTDTMEVDAVSVAEIAGRDFTAFVYGFDCNSPIPMTVQAVDYKPQHTSVYPSTNRHQMICFPIGPKHWVSLATSDVYNKYLKECIVGDFIY